jgi:hypothetical protein
MSEEEREPDHTEDPRKQGVGQGYPETDPAGEGGDDRSEPDTHTEQDEEPSKATGNPGAAGG